MESPEIIVKFINRSWIIEILYNGEKRVIIDTDGKSKKIIINTEYIANGNFVTVSDTEVVINILNDEILK